MQPNYWNCLGSTEVLHNIGESWHDSRAPCWSWDDSHHCQQPPNLRTRKMVPPTAWSWWDPNTIITNLTKKLKMCCRQWVLHCQYALVLTGAWWSNKSYMQSSQLPYLELNVSHGWEHSMLGSHAGATGFSPANSNKIFSWEVWWFQMWVSDNLEVWRRRKRTRWHTQPRTHAPMAFSVPKRNKKWRRRRRRRSQSVDPHYCILKKWKKMGPSPKGGRSRNHKLSFPILNNMCNSEKFGLIWCMQT